MWLSLFFIHNIAAVGKKGRRHGSGLHKRRYKCEISFGNASFIVPGSEMDVNVAKDNLSPSLPSHSPVNYISDVSGLDPAGLNSLTTADSPYIFFLEKLVGLECPLAPGNSGHQEENRGVAKGGEDTSKVLLLRPPLKRAPLSTPPTQTTLYDIESAFGTYIIPSLESKFRYDVVTSQVSSFSLLPFFGFSNVLLIFCGSRRRCKTANYPPFISVI